MTFQVNGMNGKYDSKVNNESVKYGRNAANNHIKHIQAPIANDNFAIPPILDFSISSQAAEKNLEALNKYADKNDAYLNTLPPLEYEYRYIPNLVNGQIDKKALLGAAYEEMGGVKELSVEEFEHRYIIDDSMTAKPIDINRDGKIDIAEYGANIVAADVLSKGTTDATKANGIINATGMNAVLEYSKKSNASAAAKLYSSIYNTYDLGKALNEF